MLAVLANETSAIIQFRLTQFLSYISPEERVAVEVKTNSVSSNQSKEHFNESDRIVLNEINQTMKHLKEMKILKVELNQTKKENERRKQAINLNIFANDDLNQYNRRENIRIYGAPESSGKKDDGKGIFFK